MSKNDNWEKIPHNKIFRSEYACSDDWVRSFLERMQVAHVATLMREQPFISPVVYWYDREAHEIYFHTNVVGRLRANVEQHDRVCLEVSRVGELLPSNLALEFGLQYESAVVFGHIRRLENEDEQRRALYGLIRKYFPDMVPGEHFRPITQVELKRTSVFALAIESWSGKRNWHAQAEQGEDWPPLPDVSGRTWAEM